MSLLSKRLAPGLISDCFASGVDRAQTLPWALRDANVLFASLKFGKAPTPECHFR